jgi:hypothetical protein
LLERQPFALSLSFEPFALSLSFEPFALSLSKGFDRLSPNGVNHPRPG